MFKPLNEAPLTASVSCWPSEASEVLMSPIWAPGFCRLSQSGRDRVEGGDDRVDRGSSGRQERLPLRQGAVRGRYDAAVGGELGGDRPVGRVIGGGGDA